MQAPMPELPIPRGMAGPGLLAHVAVAKFCDHIPLYRQAEIDARAGVEIDRSQRAEWLGHVAWLLRPLGGSAPPAVLYRYTPDRKGEHCRAELAGFTGWLHADGYAGFGRLYEIGAMKSSDAALLRPHSASRCGA